MSTPIAVVEGIVNPDGTLVLQEKVNLPPGKVQVTLVPMTDLPEDDPFWQRMKAIWAGQKAHGHVPRRRREVEADRLAFREEFENDLQDAIRLQEECRRARQEAARQSGESGA